MTIDLTERTRHWALELTRQPSETGTADEARFGPWLAQTLRAGSFGGAEVWTFPVGPDDPRHCVAMFLRGHGRRTVLLTGHYDTVTTEDFADLRALAIRPKALLAALEERLRRSASTPAERLAQEDFRSGDYLPGRGLLDMKGGLAAGLAVAERFAATPTPEGNLLFLAVPDEEVASVGARAAAPELVAAARRREVDLVAAINLDAIADNGDGSAGRVVATGTVGKLLPTAFVVGVPTHAGFPQNGINAGVLIAAIITRMEWAAELTDMTAPTPGTPPSLLSLRDGKAGYDVTTPGTAFATWNVLLHRRSPADVLDAFEALCREAANECAGRLAALIPEARRHEVPVMRYADVLAEARGRRADVDALLAAMVFPAELPLPERCRRATALVWAASGRAGPAVVTGFGGIPYLATELSASPAAGRVRQALEAAVAAAAEPVAVTDYFAGISDVSFFGEADPRSVEVVAANTPLWLREVRWPETGLPARIPTINIGPWGRDYHTPLERIHTGYAFGTLPRLLCDVVDRILADPGSRRSVVPKTMPLAHRSGRNATASADGMRTVFIHAGLPKCGSTALQFALASNRSAVLGSGAFYPENERDGIGHMPLCNDLIEASRAQPPSPMLQRMLQAFAGSGAQNLLLSSEGFAVRSKKFSEAAFGALFAGLKVEVVVFVRRRDEWVRSFYKQSVKSVSRLYAGSLQGFVEQPPPFAKRLEAGYISGGIERFANLVKADRVHIVSLDAERKGTPELFGAIIGIPLESLPGDASVLNGRKAIQFSQGQAINLAFSDTDTLFLAACNTGERSREDSHRLRIALSEADTSDIAPKLRLLHPALAETLLREGGEDDARLHELFGTPLTAFRPTIEADADYRQALTAEEMREIMARVGEKRAAMPEKPDKGRDDAGNKGGQIRQAAEARGARLRRDRAQGRDDPPRREAES